MIFSSWPDKNRPPISVDRREKLELLSHLSLFSHSLREPNEGGGGGGGGGGGE